MQRELKMPVKMKDNTSGLVRNAEEKMNLVLSAITSDVYRLSQRQVPVKDGPLQSSGQIVPGHLKYQIKYNKEYAAYQHRGARRDGTHVVRNYTTPGTKAKYLQDPADTILRKRDTYLKRYFK
jgi:hypothetical protein